MAVSIATINVNGIRDGNKRMGFLHWLSHLSLDIVCLQEVHVLTSAEGSSWFDSFGYRSFVSPASNHARGTVILFRPIFLLSGSFCDTEGRFVLCDFSFRGKFFRVASLYAPNVNPDRNDFFSFVLAKIDPSVHTFLCGDFNSVFDRTLDRWGSCPFDYSRESSALLSGLSVTAVSWMLGASVIRLLNLSPGQSLMVPSSPGSILLACLLLGLRLSRPALYVLVPFRTTRLSPFRSRFLRLFLEALDAGS